MNVACAVSAMSENYRTWFEDLFIINHEDNTPDNLDLLILTGGGADISPERYGENFNGVSSVDLERDELEFSILREVLDRNPGVKILGVCRGLQLLNVFFGGTLYQDMDSIGAGHSRTHSLIFKAPNTPFSWLTRVNSLHHQAVKRLGERGSYYPLVLASEPITSIPEIVAWENMWLGVQFHPEMFDYTLGKRFFSIIRSWVLDGIPLSFGIMDHPEHDEYIDEDNDDEDNEDDDLEPDDNSREPNF